ncbi:MAG: hypothetical protein Q9226_006752 [Calogaya cf. arnoldii]
MDPSIWCNLPLEVLCTVVENCDHETLIDWSCTSEFFYNISSDVLWETLRFTGQEIYLAAPHSTHNITTNRQAVANFRRKDGMIVYFLTHNALRQRFTRKAGGFPLIQRQTAKLPSTRVKDLRFDFDGKEIMMDEHEDEEIMRQTLELTPQLRRCYVEGELSNDTWGHLMRATSLRSLEIRPSAEYVKNRSTSARAGRWAYSQILSLQHLVGLSQLNSLTIGRLTTKEARGLAQAVVNLPNLSAFSISASAPCKDTEDVRSIFADFVGESPIFEFLASVLQHWSRRAVNNIPPLARTLRKMELRDVYQGGAGQLRQDNLLFDTLQYFQDLNTLQICLVRPRALQVFFSQAHLPALQHFMVSGCHHLFTEKDWALVGVVLPKTEHHDSDVLALGFQQFLRRHRKNLSSVTLTRPF